MRVRNTSVQINTLNKISLLLRHFVCQRRARNASDWWWSASDHGKSTDGRRSQSHPLSPSRLPLRAYFHRERERRLGTRQARLRQGGLVGRSSNLPAGGENRARKWIILPCFSYSFYTFLNEKYVSHIIQRLDSKFENYKAGLWALLWTLPSFLYISVQKFFSSVVSVIFSSVSLKP